MIENAVNQPTDSSYFEDVEATTCDIDLPMVKLEFDVTKTQRTNTYVMDDLLCIGKRRILCATIFYNFAKKPLDFIFLIYYLCVHQPRQCSMAIYRNL